MVESARVHGNAHQDDDDEQFLYGDDNTAPATANATNDSGDGTTKKRKLSNGVDDDLEDLYAPETKSDTKVDAGAPPKKQVKLSKNGGQANNDDDDDDDDDGSGSESEYETDESDDVQFIIGTGSNPQQLSSKSTPATGTAASSTTAESTESTANTNKELQDALQQNSISTNPLIDLDAKGLYEGQPIEEVDPEIIKEKPWRGTNAKMSDYFNYGFNEATWMEYLHRQEKLLTEYDPQKLLQKLLFLQQQGKLNNTQDNNKTFGNGNNSNGENSEISNLAGTLAYQQRQQQQDPPLPESVKMNNNLNGSHSNMMNGMNMNMNMNMPPMPMGNMNNNNMNRNIPGQPPFPMPMFGGFPPIPFPFNVPMGNMSPPPPKK